MESLRVRLGQVVRELRSTAGFSQEAFAAKAKVHRTFMGTIERGETNVSLDTLERIAHGLDISIWELMRKAEALGVRRGTYGRQKGEREPPSLRKVAEEKSR